MSELFAIGVLAGIAIYALLKWRPPISGQGEIIVRLYFGRELCLIRLAKCNIRGNEVKSACVGRMDKDFCFDRVTLALIDFPDVEAECKIERAEHVFAGADLTLCGLDGPILKLTEGQR